MSHIQLILRNSGHCRLCDSDITSDHDHDFVKCKCGEIFVDGGHSYQRAGYTNRENFKNTAIAIDFETLEQKHEFVSKITHVVNKHKPIINKHFVYHSLYDGKLLKDLVAKLVENGYTPWEMVYNNWDSHSYVDKLQYIDEIIELNS